jgi:hypothetical protein
MIDLNSLVSFITIVKEHKILDNVNTESLCEKDCLVYYFSFLNVIPLKDLINSFFDHSSISINNMIVQDFVKLISILHVRTNDFLGFLRNNAVQSEEDFNELVVKKWPLLADIVVDPHGKKFKISFSKLVNFYISNDDVVKYLFTNLNQYIHNHSVTRLVNELQV